MVNLNSGVYKQAEIIELDNFYATSVDSNIWSTTTNNSATVSYTNGALRLRAGTSTSAANAQATSLIDLSKYKEVFISFSFAGQLLREDTISADITLRESGGSTYTLLDASLTEDEDFNFSFAGGFGGGGVIHLTFSDGSVEVESSIYGHGAGRNDYGGGSGGGNNVTATFTTNSGTVNTSSWNNVDIRFRVDCGGDNDSETELHVHSIMAHGRKIMSQGTE